jgi:hypothetical protein
MMRGNNASVRSNLMTYFNIAQVVTALFSLVYVLVDEEGYGEGTVNLKHPYIYVKAAVTVSQIVSARTPCSASSCSPASYCAQPTGIPVVPCPQPSTLPHPPPTPP